MQLAIAPAGNGKTTAMRALTLAWTQDGGKVIGLAPSAAAAAVLAEQTGIRTDTLAKLTWSLDHGELPEWAAAVDPSTLVIIDEAGMADTLSLDTTVQFAIGRGANARLVGDDQQLAAIGAGGVLRDIQHIHGALRLTELHRFTEPAEAAASLALREGDPSGLEFYLDQGRVHVGDIATTTEDAFSAWVSDRAAGLDSIMLAPTRPLVAELNRRARAHRLDHTPTSFEVRLADGNLASVGEVIITRSNDRRLRLTPTDWVKNGDRWTVTHVGRHGDLTVRHTRSHLTVRLPADYVRTSTGLGYATTIHSAQGVSADTTHGLATGHESRQQLYTMLTRGRAANHLYLQVVGDGDPHALIRPDTISPRTPTETLQQIIARDEAPVSAQHVAARAQQRSGPAFPGGPALHRRPPCRSRTARWARDRRGARPSRQVHPRAHRRTRLADPASPPARPRGRNWRAATPPHADSRQWTRPRNRRRYGRRPLLAPPRAHAYQPRSAALAPGHSINAPGPSLWGDYLAKRSQLVAELAGQFQDQVCQGDAEPVWAPSRSHPSTALIGEIAVWRAANGINSQDPRPTGGTQLETLPALWKQRLDRDIARATYRPADARADERQAGRTALSPGDDRQRPYQRPERRPSGPPAPSR